MANDLAELMAHIHRHRMVCKKKEKTVDWVWVCLECEKEILVDDSDHLTNEGEES